MQPICTSRHPHVHPGTAAVNQTAGSLAIKGRPFATDNHSISKSHQMNINLPAVPWQPKAEGPGLTYLTDYAFLYAEKANCGKRNITSK